MTNKKDEERSQFFEIVRPVADKAGVSDEELDAVFASLYANHKKTEGIKMDDYEPITMADAKDRYYCYTRKVLTPSAAKALSGGVWRHDEKSDRVYLYGKGMYLEFEKDERMKVFATIHFAEEAADETDDKGD